MTMTNDELKALVAEDFFYESLKNSKSLGGIKFDYVEKNIKGRDGNLEGQYDIATMTLSKESENITLNNGFFVLKQSGEGIKTIVRKEKIY